MTAKQSKLSAFWLSAVFGLAACGNQDTASVSTPPEPVETAASAASSPASAPQQAENPSAAWETVAASDTAAAAQTEASAAQTPAAFLGDAAALQAAEDAFKALPQFGGKPVNVFQTIHFYGGSDPRISVEVQDPNKPENVDHYEYENGKWNGPQPVQLSGSGRMKDNVVPLNKIPFAAVAKIHRAWSEKAKEVGGREAEPDHIYFSLFVPTGRSKWYVGDIETDRARYDFEFHNDGSVKSFKKQ
ncbi:Uncharacterised protein [Kingella potus]|uniref:Lipoprotein n=1 Tax=Kingella potus TaxID=265175 RepID=A0A377R1M3_9NEIS|nr:hypothetical protein [Kingella potus]UOP01184.1 hypothetical protein LVJ84_02420 [Kingella potus]STR00890.1 Uncharacterised protein [Kingella potus]